ncbi:unnamed protein product [Calypogeia fissa]
MTGAGEQGHEREEQDSVERASIRSSYSWIGHLAGVLCGHSRRRIVMCFRVLAKSAEESLKRLVRMSSELVREAFVLRMVEFTLGSES